MSNSPTRRPDPHITVGALKKLLAQYPDDQILVINWYDGGPAMLSTGHVDTIGDIASDEDLWVQQ